jgi:hypothetical protein
MAAVDRDNPDEPKQTMPAGHRILIPTREAFDRFVKRRSRVRQEVVNALPRQTGLLSDPSDRDAWLQGVSQEVSQPEAQHGDGPGGVVGAVTCFRAGARQVPPPKSGTRGNGQADRDPGAWAERVGACPQRATRWERR